MALVQLCRWRVEVQLDEKPLLDQVGDGGVDLVFEVVHVLVRVNGADRDVGDVGFDVESIGGGSMRHAFSDALCDDAGKGGKCTPCAV